jgi:hypothetical protein
MLKLYAISRVLVGFKLKNPADAGFFMARK